MKPFAGPAKGGGTIHAADVDVTDKPSIEAVVAAAGGTIDVLVYVAGGIRGQRPKPLEEVPIEDFRQIVDANLTGAFLFAQAVAPGMKRAGPSAVSSRAAASPRSASRSNTTTDAPASASPSAIARPSPWAAPVTIATRPSSRNIVGNCTAHLPCGDWLVPR